MKQRMKEYAPILELFVVLDNIHSFIHYGDLYSAPSRLLLRSAPDPCTTKKKSFETRVECVRKNTGEQSLRQRKPIPHRGTNHRECTGLGCGCTSDPCQAKMNSLQKKYSNVQHTKFCFRGVEYE